MGKARNGGRGNGRSSPSRTIAATGPERLIVRARMPSMLAVAEVFRRRPAAPPFRSSTSRPPRSRGACGFSAAHRYRRHRLCRRGAGRRKAGVRRRLLRERAAAPTAGIVATLGQPGGPFRAMGDAAGMDRLGRPAGSDRSAARQRRTFNELVPPSQQPNALDLPDPVTCRATELRRHVDAASHETLIFASDRRDGSAATRRERRRGLRIRLRSSSPGRRSLPRRGREGPRPEGGARVDGQRVFAPLGGIQLGWFRPLDRLSHRREPRSPEDQRETLAGGSARIDGASIVRLAGPRGRARRVARRPVASSLVALFRG